MTDIDHQVPDRVTDIDHQVPARVTDIDHQVPARVTDIDYSGPECSVSARGVWRDLRGVVVSISSPEIDAPVGSTSSVDIRGLDHV